MDKELRISQQPLEFRNADDGTVKVSGYAAVFNEPADIGGYFTEEIAPGAFSNALQRGDDVVFLVNHDGLPLARTRSGTLDLKEDNKGLFMSAELDTDDPDVSQIVPKMKRGDLDKMSFAFYPTKQEWDESGEIPKRTISDLDLFDVSIVTTPAYEGTDIGLRSLEAFRKEKKSTGQASRRMRMKGRLAK